MGKAVVRSKDQFKTKSIKNAEYPLVKIRNVSEPNVKIENTLPFRVKFLNIGIGSYGPGNVPPIGIQVIGFNNFIL
jgi:hypothetical protein